MMRSDAELLLCEACPLHNLTHKRLTGGKIAVCLDPHGSCKLEATFGDALLHALVHFWGIFFKPLENLWLALAIMKLWVTLHQVEDG